MTGTGWAVAIVGPWMVGGLIAARYDTFWAWCVGFSLLLLGMIAAIFAALEECNAPIRCPKEWDWNAFMERQANLSAQHATRLSKIDATLHPPKTAWGEKSK